MDRALLAEKVSAVERHLKRVADKLPEDAAQLQPGTDASDAVVLHLWQAVQIVIDLAVSQCVRLHLGTPQSYRDAFEHLARAQVIPEELGKRLARAAGFRNAVAHAYEGLDLARVHAAATTSPQGLKFVPGFRSRCFMGAPGAFPDWGQRQHGVPSVSWPLACFDSALTPRG